MVVVQSPIALQDAPSCRSHLYCCGAAPPFGTAVIVMLVPTGCGAGLLGVSVTAESREEVVVVGIVVVVGVVVVVVLPEIG